MSTLTDITPYCTYKGQPVYNKKAVRMLLEVSEKTLERYVALKLITARRMGVGRFSVGFFQKDLDAFMERGGRK